MSRMAKSLRVIATAVAFAVAINVAIAYASGVPAYPSGPRPKTGKDGRVGTTATVAKTSGVPAVSIWTKAIVLT